VKCEISACFDCCVVNRLRVKSDDLSENTSNSENDVRNVKAGDWIEYNVPGNCDVFVWRLGCDIWLFRRRRRC